MYIQLKNPTIDAYSLETGKFIGQARFTPTEESEKALLDWINYREPLGALIMLESNFVPSENYVQIVPNQTYQQRGIFRALLKDGNTGEWVPIEIYITYDWKTRSTESGAFNRSVELDNMRIDRVVRIEY